MSYTVQDTLTKFDTYIAIRCFISLKHRQNPKSQSSQFFHKTALFELQFLKKNETHKFSLVILCELDSSSISQYKEIDLIPISILADNTG